ncbi:MAG: hypothetical protein MRZ63_10860 [Anaerostipes sp.]|nr:hypothetical protein [Anaerostipes sp.]
MVNEEKVKLMTKMAIYESGKGKMDLEISHFHTNEYMKMEVVKSVIVNTIVYCAALGFILLLMMDKVIEAVNNHQFRKYMLLFVMAYLLFIFLEAMIVRERAKQRYLDARPRVRAYKKNLAKLHFMYELEEENITNPKEEKLEDRIEEELDGETIDF